MEDVQLDPNVVGEAVDVSILNQISFWNSLETATAESAKFSLSYSQDLNPGQIIWGVRIEYPFLQ
jgi:predicted nucleic acid-binding protein